MNSILHKILAPAVLAAAALITTSAMAETTVKVPFNFTAAGQVCPAGLYTIQHEDGSAFVTLMRKGTSQVFTWTVGPGAPGPTDNKVALKFDEIGKDRVLQSVQYGALITSRLDKKALANERESAQLSGGR